MLIFYKSIDKSALTEGFAIPVSFKAQLMDQVGFLLKRGEKRQISIMIDGDPYSAIMTNIQFDEKRYPTHDDLLQIRYSKNSPLAKKLREKFTYTRNLINAQFNATGTTRLSGLAEQDKEFMAIYSTPVAGTIMIDCIRNSEFKEETNELASLPEALAESILDGSDPSSDIVLKTKVCKIRKLTRAIGNDLKKIYGYRCQICGEYIGESYGSNLIHAHHIDYFTKSKNNDASNIMIVCPNHHGIIHDKNPTFDWVHKQFHYPNGFVEGLKLNVHL